MKYIKLALISFVFLFLAVWLLSLVFPSQVKISRAQDFVGQPSDIFSIVEDTSNWKAWNPLFADSLRGNQEMAVVPDGRTDSTRIFLIRQPGRKDVRCGFQVYGHGNAQTYTLQHWMEFKLGIWPWQKFSSLFYEESYGREMEQTLTHLKALNP